MVLRETCPQCGSRRYKRNGHIHTGKQNHRCKLCGCAFVLNPENHLITEEQRTLIERLLERISLLGICRAVGVGLRWLLQFMVERFQAAPKHLYIQPSDGSQAVILLRLGAELDELWSLSARKQTGNGCPYRYFILKGAPQMQEHSSEACPGPRSGSWNPGGVVGISF